MKEPDGFYTMKGYALQGKDNGLSSAMEDYLEMIARLSVEQRQVRVVELSKMLHVKASSVTKMVQQLSRNGFLTAEKYGEIILTQLGYEQGCYLLHRHEVLHRFLCLLNQTENELEQAEKIEHYLDERTVENLERLNSTLLQKNSP